MCIEFYECVGVQCFGGKCKLFYVRRSSKIIEAIEGVSL